MPRGTIRVIVGPMFSGKTQELLKRLRLWKYVKPERDIFLFRHKSQALGPEQVLQTHAGDVSECIDVENHKDILKHVVEQARRLPVIGIDEAQFFDHDLTRKFVDDCANKGWSFVIAGLHKDSRGEVFGNMPTLMWLADEVISLKAICVKCGKPAYCTYRKTTEACQILLDNGKNYEARCWECWEPR